MLNKNEITVVVAMSGGVDSSVSAYLLKKEGYNVSGLFMKNWEEDDNSKYCSAANDLADAYSVCNKIGIKLYTVNFSAEYWDNVFKYFLLEYKNGRTPNPDILCNKEIKFKVFLNFAIKNFMADYIATGHYVRSNNKNSKYQLLRGLDSNKDQSYFLYTLSYRQISKCIFPVGCLKKIEVRQIASKINLVNAKKKDSTGICFIGKRKFSSFLSCYLPDQVGEIVTVDGCVIGKHNGLMYHTLGQRKGLGIGGKRNMLEKPWYVVGKDIKKNQLIVSQEQKHYYLMSCGLIANQLYWVNREDINKSFRCSVKTRYRQSDIPCTVIKLNNNSIKVVFDYLVSAVTPGQSAVFYINEICIGGGVIESLIR
ncbi:tRNA-specific 2-thiouridylase MnmA [Candidatus Providencia siddallii]|uniref:tRNA-specific 2-thiouridylase MnmA n=1 Tax=Candidatus Providencia siddallii TaxID=1715285 RepID=A0A0M6W6L9_9GAMM|nr:tRNA-specific 2-thiouridylase MnmA [Candidatus Providencia siddallii]